MTMYWRVSGPLHELITSVAPTAEQATVPRDPTEAMMKAASHVFLDKNDWDFDDIWRAMYDAALAESRSKRRPTRAGGSGNTGTVLRCTGRCERVWPAQGFRPVTR